MEKIKKLSDELMNTSFSKNSKQPEDSPEVELLKELKHDFGKFRSLHRPFGKFKRKLIFLLIFYLNILVNVDHGAIPAATTVLKRELNLDNVALGTIGSIVYLGLVLGAMSAGLIFSNYSSKWIICLSLLTSCFFLYLFTVVETELPLAISRVGCGFFQVFCYIYFPVWVDQFGIISLRDLWITFLQMGVPVGTMLGYVSEAYFINSHNNWRGCFYAQIILLLIGVVLLVLTPDKFFSKNYKRSQSSQEEVETELENLREKANTATSQGRKLSYKVLNAVYSNKYGRPSQYSIFSVIDENDETEHKTYYSVVMELINNKVYVFTMLGICCLFFIVTGIQFWISDYLQIVLKVEHTKVFIIFAFVCISAPVLGVISGGYYLKHIGGYQSKFALDACVKISVLAAISGAFLPVVDNYIIFVILMWLLLFFGASIVPGLIGIMISSAPNNAKEIANSISHLCYNLLGYLPSPFLYGLICKHTGGSTSRYGLAFILLWSYFGVFFLFIAKYFRDKNLEENNSPIQHTKESPFESSMSNKETKDDSNDFSENKQHLGEHALTAFYGRLSNFK